MPETVSPANRALALKNYDSVGDDYDADFDDLARLASEICDTPIAMINLVYLDQQFSKSHIGTPMRIMPTEISFCKHTILENEMVVSDAHADKRFQNNPLVKGDPNIRFYAGATMRDPEGIPLGALCVIDTKPRELSDFQLKALRTLSKQAMRLFDLRRILSEREKSSAINAMIMDSAVDYAIVSTDGDGMIETWNTGAELIMGWTEGEVIGKHIDTFFTEDDKKNDRAEKEMKTSVEDGGAKDTRWHLRRDGSKFWANGRMMPLTTSDDNLHGFVKILRDRTDQHKLDEERKNLNQEILHRLKNSMAVVQSLTQQTIRRASSLDDAYKSVGQRINSYANAHNILLQSNWQEASLNTIIQSALLPYEDLGEQFIINGPDLKASERRVIGLTLAMHELITNAIKYGALSVPEGRVAISWSQDPEGAFSFQWNETGGPRVTAPDREGFGSTILSKVTGSYFSGKAGTIFHEGGINYEIDGSLTE